MVVTHYGPSSQNTVLTPISSFSNWSFKNMKLSMFIFCEQFEVCNPVIGSIMIPMVNFLANYKISAKVLFHNQSVLQHITATIFMWMVRRVYCYISTRHMPPSSFPVWMFISHIDAAAFLKVTSITMATNKHYWLMFLVIPTSYLSAATTRARSQELSNGGLGL